MHFTSGHVSLLSVIFLIELEIVAWAATNDCPNLVDRCCIDRIALTLKIADLLDCEYLYQVWNLSSLVDLSCLPNIQTVEFSPENPSMRSQLISLTTSILTPSSGYLHVEYFTPDQITTKTTAKLLVTNVERIKSLILNYNDLLTMIPERSFSLFRNLTHLNLAYNRIGPSDSYKSLHSTSLHGLEQLRHLNLSHNPLILPKQDLEFLFTHVSKLTHLDLSSTSFSQPKNMGDLASMRGLGELVFLNFSTRDGFTSTKVSGNPFKLMIRLEILDLRGERIEFSSSFFFENRNLRELNMSYTSDNRVNQSIFIYLSQLERLDLSGSLMSLSRSVLAGLSALKSLSIRSAALTSEFLEEDAFLETPMLSRLDFYSNEFTVDVIWKLACLNASLEWLSLEKNSIWLLDTSANISALYRLRELYLSNNIKMYLDVPHFVGLSRLKVLELAHDSIERLTPSSFRGLGELERLDLSDNFIQLIENGTFAPLIKLNKLNLTGNSLKNLFLFGLDTSCSIFLDGLILFNISTIDLQQMTRQRQQSFLVKKMHLKKTPVSIVRNVRVDWRSASSRPNCSLYFHVLRHFKPLSFELDPAYLDACLSEELVFSADRWAFPISQESSLDSESFHSYHLKPVQIDQFPPDTTILASFDGFLIGVNYPLRKLITIEFNGKNFTTYSTKLDEDVGNFRVICCNLLISSALNATAQLLWNMTDKADIQPMFLMYPTFSHNILCLVSNKYLITHDYKSLYFLDAVDFTQYSSQAFSHSLTRYFSVAIYQNRYLAVSMYGPVIWLWDLNNISQHGLMKPAELATSPNEDDAIRLLVFGPDGYLAATTFDNEIYVCKLVDGKLRLIRSLKGEHMQSIFILKSGKSSEVFIASVGSAISLWSVRYGKQIDRLALLDARHGRLISAADSSILAHFSHNLQFFLF